MHDLIFMIFGDLRDYQSLSPDILPLTGFFALVGGLILSKFTGSIGNLTLPINCSVLFIGAMIANWLMQNFELPLNGAVEAPMAVSMLGMTMSSLIMLWFMQGDSVRD